MVQKIISLSAFFLFFFSGIYLFLHPSRVSEKLRSFYSSYPLVKLAGEKQLTARDGGIRLLGIVLIMLGLLMVMEIMGK